MINNIAIIFGGRSCEHEISILTALQVMQALADKYHVIPVYITKNSEMYSHKMLMETESYQTINQIQKASNRVYFERRKQEVYLKNHGLFKKKQRIDFVFPIFHGRFGEDGCMQGFLEMLHVAYAGCDVLASAICLSKITTKKILAYHQLPTLPFAVVDEKQMDIPFFPCIIKPDNLGSSIGITVAHNQSEFATKVKEALQYDHRCLVEPFKEHFYEVNCSVKKKDHVIEVSSLEKVDSRDEILTFENKYQSNGKMEYCSDREIDPSLDEQMKEEVFTLSKKIYEIFNCSGVIRIDFMITDKKVYINEINNIPGSYAYYLWQEKDMRTLLEEIMEDSIKRYQQQEMLITTFESDVLFEYNGSKK